MNIQVFGRGKCSEIREAERYFKERGIRFQSINLNEKGMSRGEFTCMKQTVGGLENMIGQASRDRDPLTLIQYIAQGDRGEKVFENQKVLKTLVVRNAPQVTVEYHSEMRRTWEQGTYLEIGRI